MDSLNIILMDTLAKTYVKGVLVVPTENVWFSILKDYFFPVILLTLGFFLSEVTVMLRKKDNSKKERKEFYRENYKLFNEFESCTFSDLLNSAGAADVTARIKVNNVNRMVAKIEREYRNHDWLLSSKEIELFDSLIDMMNTIYWRLSQVFIASELAKENTTLPIHDDIKKYKEELSKLYAPMQKMKETVRNYLKVDVVK